MLTIDDARTRDMDDAISVASTETGWTVRVSIADVAKYVLPKSALDVLARERGATQYFATGNSPMLPRDLAEWKLSLFPNRIRKTINIEISLNREAVVTSKRVSLGTIVSQAKLNYGDVQGILNQEGHPFCEELQQAKVLALGLLTRRRNAGALIFYDLNKGWVTTEDGTVKRMKRREDTIGYIIIQELMILTNVVMAQYFAENDIPTLFRNHEPLDVDPGRQALMEDIQALANAPVIDLESLQRRGNGLFKRAEYGPICVGHYGLNEKAYVHFTSPIRRYADLVAHQQLRAHLKKIPLPHTKESLAETAVHLNTLSNEQRDRTRQIFVGKAEDRARTNIEGRRLDGLSAKDFERAVKVEIRSGASPSDALAEAWARRLEDNNIPMICLTEILKHVRGTEGWDTLREMTVEHLEDHPEDAVSILAQAHSLGWPATEYKIEQGGPPHTPSFKVTATLYVNDLDVIYAATIDCPRGGSAKTVKQKAAVKLLQNIVTLKGDSTSHTEWIISEAETPAPVKKKKEISTEGKNPVSVLMEVSQARMVSPPRFTFDMKGPPHAPVVTCSASFYGLEVRAVAASKQDAKTAAAKALVEKVL